MAQQKFVDSKEAVKKLREKKGMGTVKENNPGWAKPLLSKLIAILFLKRIKISLLDSTV